MATLPGLACAQPASWLRRAVAWHEWRLPRRPAAARQCLASCSSDSCPAAITSYSVAVLTHSAASVRSSGAPRGRRSARLDEPPEMKWRIEAENALREAFGALL